MGARPLLPLSFYTVSTARRRPLPPRGCFAASPPLHPSISAVCCGSRWQHRNPKMGCIWVLQPVHQMPTCCAATSSSAEAACNISSRPSCRFEKSNKDC